MKFSNCGFWVDSLRRHCERSVAIQCFDLKGILDCHVPPRASRLKAAPRKDDLISVSLASMQRDGACFLYVIANSIQALRDKTVSQAQWCKCTRQLPFKLDDFLAGRGTEKLDDNPIYFEIFCEEFLKVLNVDSKIVSHANISSGADLKRLVQQDSVMLATIYGGNHWVAVVDVQGDDIYMACSAQALSGKAPYREAKSPRLNRIFNLLLKFDDLDLWKNYGLLISHTPCGA